MSAKDAGKLHVFRFGFISDLGCFFSIVEFASPEDAQRSIRELSESPLLGRPVFIRAVNSLCFTRFFISNFLGSRTVKKNPVSVQPPFQEKLVWLWQAQVSKNLLLVLQTITVVVVLPTLGTSFTLEMYVTFPDVVFIVLIDCFHVASLPSRMAGSQRSLPYLWRDHSCRYQH